MWRSRLFWRRIGVNAAFALVLLAGAEFLRRSLGGAAGAEAIASTWIVLFAAFISLGTAWLSVRLMRTSLRQLTQAATAIAQGHRRQRVHLGASGEFGDLARAFNEMSRSLEREIAQIDRDRQQLRAVFRCMVEGVIVIDATQNVQFMNEAASRLLKAPLEASKGRKLWELVRNRNLSAAAEAVLHSEEPYRCEVEWTDPEPRALAVQGANLVGPPMRGAVLVLQDISELRRLEQIRQEFVANVSHELKTPLAAIQAGVETLLDGALNDPVHNVRFLERVRENAERLDLLVQDLLTLSRIESGQEHLEIKPTSLGAAVEACLSRHEPRALAKNLKLLAEPPASEVMALADEEALDHLLENLVDNAIKYTPEGGRIVLRWSENGREAVLQVADSGVGIPEKDLPRIFERFYRVDRARSRELGGTGLGLSIVKHLAQALAGHVQAESKLGEGSVFTLRLPKGQAAAAAPGDASPRSP